MNPVLILLCSLLAFSANAQKTYTLKQCIDSALAANIEVRQSELISRAAEVSLRQSRMNLLPDLNASVSHGYNAGRSIDPFTNTYVTQSVTAANYGVSSGVVLFNGLTLQNRIRESAFAYDASRMEWQQQRDMLVLNVMLAYLSVLSGEDMVSQALSQSGTTEKALQRMQMLNSQGAVKPSDVSDLKGQLMNDQLSLLDARNNLESMKLLLLQLMNKPYDSAIILQRIDPSEFMSAYPSTAPEIFQAAEDRFAAIKAAELRKKSLEYRLKATKGLYFPQLSLFGGINTNYSSLAQTNNEKIPYSSQLKNNRFTSVGIGVAIPIFNNSLVRNQVKLAAISLEGSLLEEENTRLRVQQQIDQAYLNMKNAYDRYVLLLNQVNAYEESFRAAEVRFQSGVGNSVDYLVSKDRLDRASINLVNARYDFLLRKRILDYYKGETP